jgi:ubiquinone/menaquinone biosynthesis C-methylase UbiE
MVELIKSYSPESLLDVGCGIGVMVRALRKSGINASGVDFSEDLPGNFWADSEDFFVVSDAKKLPYPDGSFDIVFSSDFFEHVPEEEIDQVLSEMKRVGKRVLARVAYEDSLTAQQSKYHCTNKPRKWWVEKLQGITLI